WKAKKRFKPNDFTLRRTSWSWLWSWNRRELLGEPWERELAQQRESTKSLRAPSLDSIRTNQTSRGRWASKRFLMEFVSHLGKKLLLPSLLHKLDTKNLQREDC
ncbi:hypothetical protein LEMLEM_LOCUS20506, partial [Lemmus lemmus]